MICAGGGGPVVRNRLGELEGIEAVVDEDSTAGLLAEALDADLLVVLTDVAGVETGYGTPAARPIHRAAPADLRALQFPAGSIGPKVEAVCPFVELTGGTAAVGSLRDVDAILTDKSRHHRYTLRHLPVTQRAADREAANRAHNDTGRT